MQDASVKRTPWICTVNATRTVPCLELVVAADLSEARSLLADRVKQWEKAEPDAVFEIQGDPEPHVTRAESP
jgi:hypothetical protein